MSEPSGIRCGRKGMRKWAWLSMLVLFQLVRSRLQPYHQLNATDARRNKTRWYLEDFIPKTLDQPTQRQSHLKNTTRVSDGLRPQQTTATTMSCLREILFF